MDAPAGVAFAPVVDLGSGTVVAHEAMIVAAMPADLAEPRVDVENAVCAVQAAAEYDHRLPLHLTLRPDTVAGPEAHLYVLAAQVQTARRRPADVVVRLPEAVAGVDEQRLLHGMNTLRELGFRLAVSDFGEAAGSLWLLAAARPDLVVLGPMLCDGLGGGGVRAAMTAAVREYCRDAGVPLLAGAVAHPAHLAALHELDVRLASGPLLGRPHRRPLGHSSLPADLLAPAVAPVSRARMRPVRDVAVPVPTLAATASAEEVRQLFAANAGMTSVLLLDDDGRPAGWIDRMRFLFDVAGPFGHALNARRALRRLAEPVPGLAPGTTVQDALQRAAARPAEHAYDDFVLVGDRGEVTGLVRTSDLLRASADLEVEAAAALNPLTRLPGTAVVDDDVARRAAAGEAFALSWVDVDDFKSVNDSAGFAAGDDVIRQLGADLAAASRRVPESLLSHVGGDDFVLVTAPGATARAIEPVLDTPRGVDGRALSVSVATVVCPPGSVAGHREASRALVPVKRWAKQTPGPAWACAEYGAAPTLLFPRAQANRTSAATGR